MVENSPAIYRWDRSEPRRSPCNGRLKRLEELLIIIQPSASRTTAALGPFPSSKLLGYCLSSALRTDNSSQLHSQQFAVHLHVTQLEALDILHNAGLSSDVATTVLQSDVSDWVI